MRTDSAQYVLGIQQNRSCKLPNDLFTYRFDAVLDSIGHELSNILADALVTVTRGRSEVGR